MSKPVQIGSATVLHGDCISLVPTLGLVDAIVTDPPYHLVDMHARATRSFSGNADGSLARLAAGFMGKAWDGGDIAFRPETWATIGAALKPGGYLLAFGGTRTHHRLWCAIEDAGFVIQETIMWVHGQGFPKGRAQLKPAHEPICVAYKPGGKRTLQIDECRVPTEGEKVIGGAGGVSGFVRGGNKPYELGTGRKYQTAGRWPANVCHDGSDEVMEAFAAFPTHSAGHARSGKFGAVYDASSYHLGADGAREMGRFGDAGTAARFYYCAKASKADRAGSRHPTIKPIALMRWLVRLVTPPGGLVLDPFAGSGTTGAAALAEGRHAILIERETEYFNDIKRRLRALRRDPVPIGKTVAASVQPGVMLDLFSAPPAG